MLEWFDIEWIEIFSVFVSVALLGYVYFRMKKGPILTKQQRIHKQKEQNLLNYISNDIKKNTHEWTPVAYNMMEMKDASLVNDKKNMAVIMHGDRNKVIIKINIKAAHKYKEDDEETIATVIVGNHAEKFKKLTDEYIDSRGKELDFIEKLLKKKI